MNYKIVPFNLLLNEATNPTKLTPTISDRFQQKIQLFCIGAFRSTRSEEPSVLHRHSFFLISLPIHRRRAGASTQLSAQAHHLSLLQGGMLVLLLLDLIPGALHTFLSRTQLTHPGGWLMAGKTLADCASGN